AAPRQLEALSVREWKTPVPQADTAPVEVALCQRTSKGRGVVPSNPLSRILSRKLPRRPRVNRLGLLSVARHHRPVLEHAPNLFSAIAESVLVQRGLRPALEL